MIKRIAFNIFAWTIVFVTAFPLVWMVITSVKPQFELFRIPPTFWPEQITFEHYGRLLWETPFLLYMRNSLMLSTATTLLVVADPVTPPDARRLERIEHDARAGCLTAPDAPSTGAHEIVVRYDGADLAEIAAHAGLSPAEVVERHAAATYRVAFVGFQPGFAYLDGLPAELHTPRRATPRPRVPAGTLAIGGEWTGVYPLATPGGWNLLGTTDALLFDPRRDPLALLQPGDTVRFRPR